MPVLASILVTVIFASDVQLSLIVKPKPSNPATVVTAGVASLALQPSTVVVAIVPLMTGTILSLTLYVYVHTNIRFAQSL